MPINERYNSRAATPDAYLNHMLKFNCSQDQIQTVIACLKDSGIIQNGEVVVANIPQSLEDHMGLPKELCKQSKLIKTKLLEYAKVISSDQQKACSQDFTESLRDSLSSSAQKVITGAFDSEFANPILEMCSKELIKNFRKQTSEYFEDIFKGKYKEKAEIAKLEKDYQNAVKESQKVQNRSIIHTNEEPKTQQQSKPKSKGKSDSKASLSTQTALNSGYIILEGDKKYYDLGDLKTLDDYLDDPFAARTPIFSVTTPDKRVYTLVPYANAAGSSGIIYQEVPFALETALALGAKYGPQFGKFIVKKAPFIGWVLTTADVGQNLVDTYKFMQQNHPSLLEDPFSYSMGGGLLREAAELAWDGTKSLAQRVFYPETLTSPAASPLPDIQTLSQEAANSQKHIGRIAAVASINEGTCVQMADWTPLEKTQFLVDQSEIFGNMIDPSLQARLDGTEKHQILRAMIKETKIKCGGIGLESEIPVLDGRIYWTNRPASMEGASIVDVITRQEINEYFHTFDAKFRKAGITYASMLKLAQNMGGYKFMLYEVRPTSNWWMYGPTKLKYPNFSFTTK